MSSLQKKKRTNRKDKGNWQLAKATRTHSTSKANYLFHFMSTIPVLENLLWSQAIKITTWAFVTIAYSFFKSLFSTLKFFALYIWAPWQFLDHMTRVLINLRLNNQNRFWTGPEKKKVCHANYFVWLNFHLHTLYPCSSLMLSMTEETLSVLSTHELQSNIESFCLLELIYKLILSRLFQNFSSKKKKKKECFWTS